MKINMNRRGFLKGTGAVAATTAVAPTALANIGETLYVECVDLSDPNGPPVVKYYNQHSEKFKAFYADDPDNWQFYWDLSREQMANNLGEHVVEILETDPENYIISSTPGDYRAFIALNESRTFTDPWGVVRTSTMVVDKIYFIENHKVWGLS